MSVASGLSHDLLQGAALDTQLCLSRCGSFTSHANWSTFRKVSLTLEIWCAGTFSDRVNVCNLCGDNAALAGLFYSACPSGLWCGGCAELLSGFAYCDTVALEVG